MNISILTDEELCMLEQLTYLSEDVAEMASNLDAGFKKIFTGLIMIISIVLY
jgi:hypothetical protein